MSKQPIKITPQTQKFIDQMNALPVGHAMDWKFGLITRDVCRISKNKFELTDTSSGWQNVVVSEKTMLKLLTGEKSLLSLNWK
jgi:poly-beta-hydroxyalkanoate depolymerase